MNYDMHRTITLLAWNSLRPEDRDAWGLTVELPDSAPSQMLSVAKPVSLEEKWALYGNSLDLLGWRSTDVMAYKRWLLPDDAPIPHGGVDPAGQSVWCGDQAWDPYSWRQIPRYLVPRIVQAIAADDNEEAALMMAPLLHFLEDSACLGHIVPNRLFYDIFTPEPGTWPVVHRILDAVSPALQPAPPRSLGRTVPELVFRIGLLGEWLHAQNRSILIPLVQAAMNQDSETLERLMKPMYQELVNQLASLFYTLWRLGHGEFLAETEPIDLLQVSPWLIHPGGQYGPCLPVGYHIVDGSPKPLEIWQDGRRRKIKKGFGMTSFHCVRYLLEPDACRRFEGAVGLSARFLQDHNPDLPVTFFAATAPVWVKQVSSDLCYHPPLQEVYSKVLKTGELTPFDIELKEAQTLLFGLRPEVKKVDGSDMCAFPHAVLAHPRLIPI